MSDKEISNRANRAINDYLDCDKIMWGKHMPMYPSIQYFYESGKVSGELHSRINLMLCSFVEQITSIQTAPLRDEVERLKKQNVELSAEVKRYMAGYTKVWGEHESLIKDYNDVSEIERLRKENDELKGLVDRSNSVLRSAVSIAERKGEYTNWDGFLKQTELVLKEQHTLFYPKYIKP